MLTMSSRRVGVSLVGLVCCLFHFCTAERTGRDIVVPTKYGQVRGLRTNKANAFLGIPYAAPPVNKLR